MTLKRRASDTSIHFESMPYRIDESTGGVDDFSHGGYGSH